MSVIFEQEYINKLTRQLKYALKHNRELNYSTLMSCLKRNKDFIFDFEHNLYLDNKDEKSREELKVEYATEWLERRMWEILIANLTSYSLQYAKEKIGSFYDYVKTVKDTEPRPFEAQECSRMLSSINYNLSTNDGNRFLSQKNENFIQMLKEWLPEEKY